jgi:RNA polymerase sigma-70 factor (ECF subfamily)
MTTAFHAAASPACVDRDRSSVDRSSVDRSSVDRQLVAKYEGPLLRVAVGILRDRERARDVVQDTFVKACEVEVDGSDPRLRRWLFTVCRNRAIDVLRRESRLGQALTDLDTVPELAAMPRAEDERAIGEVFDQVARMSPRKSRVLELRFREGYSYRRIAEVTGMSVSHVGVVIHKAIRTLRKHLAVPVGLLVVVGLGAALAGQLGRHDSPHGADVAPRRAPVVVRTKAEVALEAEEATPPPPPSLTSASPRRVEADRLREDRPVQRRNGDRARRPGATSPPDDAVPGALAKGDADAAEASSTASAAESPEPPQAATQAAPAQAAEGDRELGF